MKSSVFNTKTDVCLKKLLESCLSLILYNWSTGHKLPSCLLWEFHFSRMSGLSHVAGRVGQNMHKLQQCSFWLFK